jgi:hypothetical protein
VVDEYCRLSKSIAMEAMKQYVLAIKTCFEGTYLRQLIREDIVHHMNINEEKRLSCIFGSIDCMHWIWKNFPIA